MRHTAILTDSLAHVVDRAQAVSDAEVVRALKPAVDLEESFDGRLAGAKERHQAVAVRDGQVVHFDDVTVLHDRGVHHD